MRHQAEASGKCTISVFIFTPQEEGSLVRMCFGSIDKVPGETI